MWAFLGLAAEALRCEQFSLVDVGCSGGIEPIWRNFGDRLSAIGFDVSAAEIRRLTAEEEHPGIRYVAGFVDIRPDHPFAKRAQNLPVHVENLYGRFSAGWIYEMEAQGIEYASHQEKLKLNLWQNTELADVTIHAPEFLQAEGFTDIDFLKIDVDGPDFRILQSFTGLFEKFGVLAARLEVNMFGGTGETVNSFHNTDRFMREHGYCLFRLDNRTYSSRALPARFEYDFPAQTASGRIFQSEAYYARDPVGEEWKSVAESLSDEKLLKLAAIFSVWNLPDGAAELLLAFRSRLSSLIDIDRALDLLALQAQPLTDKPLTYKEYMALFAADPFGFNPGAPPPQAPPRRRWPWRAK